ncbi:MAG: hypothetical protein Q7T55_01065, partial [Solirubrobacteraceae bacterium]|nr:hypothetical protein [Solirubrobacteraceae bacterium]
MSLRLVLGPAGARKVGTLLDAHETASSTGRTAWLVVPSSADVEAFQRELAGLDIPPGQVARGGAPFGAVFTESGLTGRLLARLGGGEEILSLEHRRAVALAAIHGTPLTALQPAARSGWLADELILLAEELSSTGDLGAGAEAGLVAWSARTSDGRGRELADLLRADAAILHRLATGTTTRKVDRATAVLTIASALRADPSAAADLHVVFQGFDDLDPVQRTLVIALGRSAADVVISLPFEPGREALAAASPLVDRLRAETTEGLVEQLGASPAGNEPSALETLAERLYEHAVHVAAPPPAPGPFDPAPAPAEADAFAELGPLVPYDDEDEEEDPLFTADLPAAPLAPASPTGSFATASSEAAASPEELTSPASLDPVSAPVVELRGGGPDEEAALVAEHVGARIAEGCLPERIAIVVGQPAGQGPAF